MMLFISPTIVLHNHPPISSHAAQQVRLGILKIASKTDAVHFIVETTNKCNCSILEEQLTFGMTFIMFVVEIHGQLHFFVKCQSHTRNVFIYDFQQLIHFARLSFN